MCRLTAFLVLAAVSQGFPAVLRYHKASSEQVNALVVVGVDPDLAVVEGAVVVGVDISPALTSVLGTVNAAAGNGQGIGAFSFDECHQYLGVFLVNSQADATGRACR